MCGIAGIATTNRMPDLQEPLDAMLRSMHHRGPDGAGREVMAMDGAVVGLCASRLAVQDTSNRGHQPMVSPETSAILAFNGEIYNVGELRNELERRGHSFRGGSDTEVVLACYDEWSVDSFARLRGMFALAIWDARRRRLLIVRDRLGIKPLYYAERDNVLVFASEVRALLSSGLVSRRVCKRGLASYLAVGAVQEPLTIIDGVRELPAGNYATWTSDGFQVAEYWSMRDAFSRTQVVESRADAAERLRVELLATVQQHLISDVNLGVFLSGGIDSSAIAALATQSGASPRTISVIFPQRKFSEERFITTISARLGTNHTQLRLDEQMPLENLTTAIEAMDQPTVDGINTFVVSQAARQAGLTVALSGLGGDELLGGYSTFPRVRRLEQLRSRTPAFIGRPAGRLLRQSPRASDRVMKLGRWLENADGLSSAYELQRELFGPAARHILCSESRSLPPVEVESAPPGLDSTNRVSYLELTGYMRNMLLRDADAMSMAHSVEVRVPFLDHNVVELLASLPGSYKVGGPSPKALLVDALGGLLPPEAVQRRKMGFTLPFDVWMRHGLRRDVERHLLDTRYGGPVAEVLHAPAVSAVWNRFIDGRTYWSRPWALFVLKVWAERHLVAQRPV